MAGLFTLEYGGTEKSFVDRGFTDPVFRSGNQTVGKFTVRIPGATALTLAPPIPFEGQVIIRRGRTAGEAGFGGGEIVFQGRQITRRLMASPSAPGYIMEFGDAWYDLEAITFQQSWKFKSSGSPSAYTWFSRLNLFQNYSTGALYNSGQQLAEILDYAITECGVNLQVGTIDPAFNLLIYPVRAARCASAIQICLQPTPDAVCWIDHSTTPPTFNCRVRTNRTALNLPYADGVTHESSEFMPRHDLQASSVVLQYQKTNSETTGDETTVWTDLFNDVYPPGSTGQELRALVSALDLRGAKETNLVAKVIGGAIDPTSLDWWQQKKDEIIGLRLKPDGVTTNISIVGGSVTVKDEADADITATWAASWPNELIDGAVCDWMRDDDDNPIEAKAVTVSAKFNYEEWDASHRKLHQVTNHIFSAKIKLTNSPLGDKTYEITKSSDPGETAPVGLAQAIYTSLNQLEYEGTHTITEVNDDGTPEVTTIIDPSYVLNLTGGAAAWATMKANIQGTTIDFFRGRTEITVGPANHLAPGDLLQLIQAFRFRVIYDNPDLQVTGKQNSGGSAGSAVTGKTAKENTSQGTPPPSFLTVSADAGSGSANWIQSDAANHQIEIKKVGADGNLLTETNRVIAKKQDIDDRGVTGFGLTIQFRCIPDCKDGDAGYRIVLCSEFIEGEIPEDFSAD